ncbi:MAG: phosphopantothenoylcysteine decarboxylase [Bdellovibrionota bacterium]
MSTRKSGWRSVVTAGSTVGRLDTLRGSEQIEYLAGEPFERRIVFDSQNPFKGKLGLYIAQELYRRGGDVVLIARKDLLLGQKIELPDECIRPFYTFDELERELPKTLTETDPDLVFMAAAVSDYVPVSINEVSDAEREGKISSSLPELNVRYRATPKLIDGIRPKIHPVSSLVGFKLVVGLSEAAMREAALTQMARAHSNFCVVNDFREISADGSVHPLRVFFRSGHMEKLVGTKAEVARQLVELVDNDLEDTYMQVGGRGSDAATGPA